MTPPNAPKAHASGSQSAALSCSVDSLVILTKRADFLKAARARKQATPSFLLQARKRADGEDPAGIRVGYTCSKKVGNAIKRNHAKRRLREVARRVLPQMGKSGWDYVLIGKSVDTSAREFTALLGDLERAMTKIHAPKKS